jgi:hypothetical protein
MKENLNHSQGLKFLFFTLQSGILIQLSQNKEKEIKTLKYHIVKHIKDVSVGSNLV